MNTDTYMYTHTSTLTHAYMSPVCVYVHVCIYTCTYINTNTCARALSSSNQKVFFRIGGFGVLRIQGCQTLKTPNRLLKHLSFFPAFCGLACRCCKGWDFNLLRVVWVSLFLGLPTCLYRQGLRFIHIRICIRIRTHIRIGIRICIRTGFEV